MINEKGVISWSVVTNHISGAATRATGYSDQILYTVILLDCDTLSLLTYFL